MLFDSCVKPSTARSSFSIYAEYTMIIIRGVDIKESLIEVRHGQYIFYGLFLVGLSSFKLAPIVLIFGFSLIILCYFLCIFFLQLRTKPSPKETSRRHRPIHYNMNAQSSDRKL